MQWSLAEWFSSSRRAFYPRPGTRQARGSWFFRFSFIDWLVVVYLLPISLAVATRTASGVRHPLALLPLASAAIYMWVAWVYHTWAPSKPWLRILYHVAAAPAIGITYFHLREIIPLVNPHLADAYLARIDEVLFSGQASVWLERWATPWAVELFSFFYQSYVYVGAGLMVWAVLYPGAPERTIRVASGVLLLFVFGHLTYLLVPARGPVYFLRPEFAGALVGGFIHRHVVSTQVNAGPLYDAFPSMHAAGTLFMSSLFTTWYPRLKVPVWIWAAMVIVSTTFLRYHYVIDLLAGTALFLLVWRYGPRVLAAYQRRREEFGFSSAPW